jgi:hypothetical protein
VFFCAQVALRTFIDNVTIQVIERHIVHGLEGIFSPLTVANMDEEEICGIASEPMSISRQRQYLEGRKKMLKEGLDMFKTLMRRSSLE